MLFRKRHRKPVASLMLGLWLITIFIGFANACGVDGPIGDSHPLKPGIDAIAEDHSTEGDAAPPGCEEFCAEDLLLLGKAGTEAPLVGHDCIPVATPSVLILTRAVARRLVPTATPPPLGVPRNLVFLRLTL